MAVPSATQVQPIRPVGAPADHAAYALARQQAMADFTHHGRIQKLWRGLTVATDTLLNAVATDAGLTLVAVGGYGRRELFPYSDVDVLVLQDADDATLAAPLIATLQQLWDMQIPVSHAVRSIAQAVEDARVDHTIAASLMDARLVCGDRRAFLRLKQLLMREVFGHNPRAFVEAKLRERDGRHAKLGDSRFLLEPHVKDGKGGLRDLQTLTWLARYCYGVKRAQDLVRPDLLAQEEWQNYRDAYGFFATVRAHLHILAGRAEERLTFDLQTRIAERMKFKGPTAQAKAEQFMLQYFHSARLVGNLIRIFCAVLEEENLRIPHAPFATDVASQLPAAFILSNGRLNLADAVELPQHPARAVELFVLAQRLGLELHPRAHLALARALPQLTEGLPHNPEANQFLLQLLLQRKGLEQILSRLNETGVLAALIPEFAPLTGQMQYDGYHTYTVDEHTLVAVSNLAALEAGHWAKDMPLATLVAKDITDRAPLYVGMLCHDIAKGTGGSHADKGYAMTVTIAARLGLTVGQGELAAWLVQNHLLLSEVAMKRDLDDPQTIADFVANVQSPERLRLLLLLTVADIKAVGPTIWNGWKGSLMRTLYLRAARAMGIALKLELELEETRATTGEAYENWQRDPDSVSVTVAHDTFRAITEITCCLSYTPMLFRLLCGVMAWMGASIVSARVRVLPEGAAFAEFGIQNTHAKSFADEDTRLAHLPRLIRDACDGKLDFARELPRRRRVVRRQAVAIEPSVYIDNHVTAQATVIEVNARDRLGLLYDILGTMEAEGLQVMTAHIATYGEKAVDVFYVKDAFGIKIDHPAKLAQIHRALLAAITVAE